MTEKRRLYRKGTKDFYNIVVLIIAEYSVTLSNNIMEENLCKEHC